MRAERTYAAGHRLGRVGAVLRIDGLTKRFENVQALDGVSFDVQPGEIFGFLGANGAGKTTTMRIVLGFLHADAGRVTWNDRETRSWPRRTWGYMPEDRGLYLRMQVLEQLEFYGTLYGMPRSTARAVARDWLARFRIAEYAERRAESLSKGNQQRSSSSRRSSMTPTSSSWTSRSSALTRSTSRC
jgi:ABC-2 type transport system ATP-binding protein